MWNATNPEKKPPHHWEIFSSKDTPESWRKSTLFGHPQRLFGSVELIKGVTSMDGRFTRKAVISGDELWITMDNYGNFPSNSLHETHPYLTMCHGEKFWWSPEEHQLRPLQLPQRFQRGAGPSGPRLYLVRESPIPRSYPWIFHIQWPFGSGVYPSCRHTFFGFIRS